MAELEPTTEAAGLRLPDQGIYSFLGGAAAVGVSLGGLVDHAVRQPAVLPPFVPLWVSLAGGALSFVWALRATVLRDRLEYLCLAGFWLSDAVASHVGEPRALVVQSLCLGALGMLVAQPWLHRMPTRLSQAGVALCISASSHGFLSGAWKFASLALVAIALLLALWIIDDLEAKGTVVAGEGVWS